MFGFFKRKKRKLTEETLLELEDNLIAADLGYSFTHKVISELRKQKFNIEITDEELQDIIANRLATELAPYATQVEIKNHKPFVILVFGTNGSGKTTTIAKLANLYKQQQLKVMVAAGDTFRAGAVQQLETLAHKLNISFFANTNTQDTTAVIYQAYHQAKNQAYDVLIADTSGRLANNTNLMQELIKIEKTLKKIDTSLPHVGLLVLDGTIGQANLAIAEGFLKAVKMHSLVITKLDGASKGGGVLPLCKQLNLPVSYIGVGEKVEDLIPFNPQLFAENLVK